MRGYSIVLGPSLLEWFISVVVVAVVVFVIAKCLYDGKGSYSENTASDYGTAKVQQKVNGSCGTVKIFDVPDKTAAMLMAIVADKLQVPLNELKFISIKEVETEEKTDEI